MGGIPLSRLRKSTTLWHVLLDPGYHVLLNPEQRRERRFPDFSLVFDHDMGVRIGPDELFDGRRDGEHLGGVVAAPAMMGRSRAGRDDGCEGQEKNALVH